MPHKLQNARASRRTVARQLYETKASSDFWRGEVALDQRPACLIQLFLTKTTPHDAGNAILLAFRQTTGALRRVFSSTGRTSSPLSALLTTASASSFSPTARFRTPLATDSTRGGETLDQVRARRGTIALSHQIIDFALHGPHGSPIKRRESETLWSLIDGLFNAGDAMPTPSPAGNTSPGAPHQPRHS